MTTLAEQIQVNTSAMIVTLYSRVRVWYYMGRLLWAFHFFLLKEGSKMDEIHSFLCGLKPTLLLAEQQKGFTSMLAYPNTEIHLIPNRHQCLFFHTEQDKQTWIDRTQNMEHTSPEFHRILGLTLGYPPKAVDFFVKREECKKQGKFNELQRLKSKVVGLHYAGISCNGNYEDLISNARWLWDTYKQEEQLKVRVDSSYVFVEYRNDKKLAEIMETFKETSVTLVS